MTHLPAQPGAGQAARGADGAARHPARRRRPRAHDQPALPARRAGRASRSRSPAARPRSARSRTAERGGDRLPDERGLHDPGRAARRVRRRSAAASRQGRRRRRRRRRSPKGADQLPFGMPAGGRRRALPRLRGAARARLIMQVDVDCSQARGAGVDPEDPPLRWEVSAGDGRTTGPRRTCCSTTDGRLQLRLRRRRAAAARAHARVEPLGGQRAHWLRCRLDSTTRSGAQAAKLLAPARDLLGHRRADRRAAAGRALRPRRRRGARRERRHAGPGLPAAQRTRCSSSSRARRSRCWTRVRRLGAVGAARRVVRRERARVRPPLRLDLATGEIEFGPAIREPDGGWRQYGAVPPKGAVLRMTQLPPRRRPRRATSRPGALTVLQERDPRRRHGHQPRAGAGRRRRRDARARTRQRAAMEIRTRYRAVTAEDFEFLCGEASPRVARAVCLPPVRRRPGPAAHRAAGRARRPPAAPRRARAGRGAAERGGRVPRRAPADRHDGSCCCPCALRGVTRGRQPAGLAARRPARVEEDVAHALYTYLNPLVGGSPTGSGDGWEFGRALNQGELYGIVHAVDGVDFVKILRVYETNLETGEQQPKPAGSHIAARARRADRVRAAHRPGRAPGAADAVAYSTNGSRIDGARPSSGDDASAPRRHALAPGAHDGAPTVASARAYLRAGAAGHLPGGRLRDALRRRARDAARPDRRRARRAAGALRSRPRPARRARACSRRWLGVELDESWPEERQRELVRSRQS